MPAAAAPRERPLITVAGSVDASRTAEIGLSEAAATQGQQACQQVGRALLEAGCDLLVYTSDPMFVEPDVVRGYVEAASDTNRGTVFVRPPAKKTVDFGVSSPWAEIRPQRDTSVDWDVAYYQAIFDVDGILLMGGGRSTRITGVVALASGVPVVPIAAFGGAAEDVRVRLASSPNYADPEDVKCLGEPWNPDSSATRSVEMLLAQRDTRARRLAEEDTDARRERRRTLLALCLTLGGLLLSFLAVMVVNLTTGSAAKSLAFGVPAISAMAGALLRASIKSEDWGWSAARGLGAGLLSVCLFIVSELIATPTFLDDADPKRLVYFLVPLGLIAGYTFDKVWEQVDAGQLGGPPVVGNQTPKPPAEAPPA